MVSNFQNVISEENTTVVAEKVHLATTKIVEQIEREWEFLTAAAVDGGKHRDLTSQRVSTVGIPDNLETHVAISMSI